MNRREKLHAAHEKADEFVARAYSGQLGVTLCKLVRESFYAGFEAAYETAEPDVCARCGAEMEKGDG